MLWINRWIGDGLVMGVCEKKYFVEGGLVGKFSEKIFSLLICKWL